MSKIKHVTASAKDKKIDDEVISLAHDESAWEKEIMVTPKLRSTSIRLSSRTIERAKFFARVHRERGYQTWLKNIIEERVNTEYELYQRLQKETVA